MKKRILDRCAITYLKLTDEGEIIEEPNQLWNDEFIGGQYFSIKASMDIANNLHFAWRHNQGLGEDTWYYASVSADDEVITEPVVISHRHPERWYSVRGFLAVNPDAIYLRMTDGRIEDEPYVAYMQKMNGAGEPVFYSDVIAHHDGGAYIAMGPLWNDRIYFFGQMTLGNPDSTLRDFFYTAADTNGEIVEEYEVAMPWLWHAELPGYIIRSADTLSMFFQYGNDNMMVQKIANSQNIDEEVRYDQIMKCTIEVSPNPFNDRLGIKVVNPDFKQCFISIHSITGRLIYRTSGFTVTDVQVPILNLGNLPSGQYFLSILSPNGIQATKTIIKLK